MSNTPNKTIPTSANIANFLAKLSDEQRRDSETLIHLMQEVSGKPPVMWGPSIIGFGQLHYKYASGREGETFQLGFSPRKGKISLYITDDATKYSAITKRLGKHSAGKACFYITRLSDIDMDALKELVTTAMRDSTRVF